MSLLLAFCHCDENPFINGQERPGPAGSRHADSAEQLREPEGYLLGKGPAQHVPRRAADPSKDSKILLGAGDAANRLRLAVERSVPFAMLGLTILVLWYAGHGTAETDLATARTRAPWNRKKTHVSIDDMLIAFRRARITAISTGQDTHDQNPARLATSNSAAA